MLKPMTERDWVLLGVAALGANVFLHLFVGDDTAIIRYCVVYLLCLVLYRYPR